MEEWKFNSKLHVVLRDNAPNMVKAMKLNGWESAGCFLHTLQLFVEQSIFEQSGVKLMMTRANKLVSYFKHSLKAMSILHKHQKALHEEDGGMISHNNLILGEKTRWSSYYYMPLRLQQQKRAIRRCDDDYEINIKSDQTLNSIDWVLIPKVISLLQPFADVTTEGERECPCISEVIPSVKYIFHELISITESGIATIKTELLAQMQRYFEGGDIREHFSKIEINKLFAIATLLDPRYKTRSFSKRENIIIAKYLLFAELYKIDISVSGSQESQQVNYSDEQNSSIKRSGWESILDSSPESDDDNVVDATQAVQVKAYFNEMRIGRDDDPFAYWKGRSV